MSEKFRNLFKRKLKCFSNSFRVCSIEYQSYWGEVLNETTRRCSQPVTVMTVCGSVGLITDPLSVNINVSCLPPKCLETDIDTQFTQMLSLRSLVKIGTA